MSEHWMDKALAEMKAMVPKTGFNVVGVDRMAPAGEALYLVGSTKDKEEAVKMAAAHTKETGNVAHVYEPDEASE